MNTCVCCGCDIPEGRQICPHCERKIEEMRDDLIKFFRERNRNDMKKYQPVVTPGLTGFDKSIIGNKNVQQGGIVKHIDISITAEERHKTHETK